MANYKAHLFKSLGTYNLLKATAFDIVSEVD